MAAKLACDRKPYRLLGLSFNWNKSRMNFYEISENQWCSQEWPSSADPGPPETLGKFKKSNVSWRVTGFTKFAEATSETSKVPNSIVQHQPDLSGRNA